MVFGMSYRVAQSGDSPSSIEGLGLPDLWLLGLCGNESLLQGDHYLLLVPPASPKLR